MQDHSETSTTSLDWTDQLRAVARFISDHELPVVSIEAQPTPAGHHDDCHVHVHVMQYDWLFWWPRLERILDEHADHVDGHPSKDFHYVVALVAGVRVQVLYITDVGQAVA